MCGAGTFQRRAPLWWFVALWGISTALDGAQEVSVNKAAMAFGVVAISMASAALYYHVIGPAVQGKKEGEA
jgi:hypothetical protein